VSTTSNGGLTTLSSLFAENAATSVSAAGVATTAFATPPHVGGTYSASETVPTTSKITNYAYTTTSNNPFNPYNAMQTNSGQQGLSSIQASTPSLAYTGTASAAMLSSAAYVPPATTSGKIHHQYLRRISPASRQLSDIECYRRHKH